MMVPLPPVAGIELVSDATTPFRLTVMLPAALADSWKLATAIVPLPIGVEFSPNRIQVLPLQLRVFPAALAAEPMVEDTEVIPAGRPNVHWTAVG